MIHCPAATNESPPGAISVYIDAQIVRNALKEK
jgi:hypothetical protein